MPGLKQTPTPAPPDVPAPEPPTGRLLSGLKTYIAAAILAGLGALEVKLHVPGGVQAWIDANAVPLAQVVAGMAVAALRAAIAKYSSKLDAIINLL